MSQITLSFRVLLVVLTFLMFTAVAGNAQSPKRAGMAKLFGLPQENRARCGLRPKQSGFSNFVAEYETYRLRGTYYSLSDGLNASLMFNNKGPEPILATPTFYSLGGTKLQLAPIVVPAASYLDVDMHQLLAHAGDEFREGSVKIGYEGGDYQLGAQIKLADPQRNLIWAEQLVYTSKFTSSKLESVWLIPYDESKTRLVVSNTTYSPVTIAVRVDGTSPQQSNPVQIDLSPSQTRVLDVLADLVGAPGGTIETKGGISITHSGEPGAVLARMFAAKPNRGYSASIPFVDPENTASQKWHGTGLRLKNLDGGTLRSALVARNTGDQVSRISGKIPYTLPNGEMASVNIPSSVVAPNSTRIINLRNLIQSANLPTSVTYAGIELEYDTPKGSVVTAVQSVSQNGDHVFQVPMFDPQKIPSSAAGFPWKADGDYHTIIYAKNESDATQKFVTHLVYEGGQYSAGEREIKAGQTLAVDFRELRDAQTTDGLRRLIPLDVNKGQIAFSIRGGQNKSLSVRSEQISLSEGVSSTYSCLNCPCPNRVIDGSIDPVSIEDVVGGSLYLLGGQVEENCYSTQFNSAIPYVDWSSLNTNVEIVDSNGYAEAVGVGTTSISASWDRIWYLYGEFSTCEPIYYPEEDNAPVEVVGVQKVQYKGPNNSAYTDATGTLYVLKDTEVSFKAIPDPTTATFPSGQPTWSGTSGATGSGQTKSVTFGTVSSSTSDFKTVVATAGESSVTVNVVVFSLSGTLNAEDFFTGRSNEKFGLKETVNLGFVASPNLTAQQMGLLQWSIHEGLGGVTNDTNANGAGEFTADNTPGNVRLSLKIQGGPSKDLGFLSGTIPIIAPTSAVLVKDSSSAVLHCQNYSSVGIQGFVYLSPKDVSFANLYFKEGLGTMQAQGFYEIHDDSEHDPTEIGNLIHSCNVVTGCEAFYDTIYTLNWTGPFSPGTATWPIEWKYGFSESASIANYVQFTTGVHYASADSQGTATISKAGSGNFTKAVSDVTSGANPCTYEVVSP